jgi:signal transduction histidine kinase
MAASIGMFTENLESLVRQRTEELETSRAQLRRMLDGLPEAVALVERPDGRILFANAPWRSLLGEGAHSPVPALLKTPAGPEGCHAFEPPGEESPRQLAIITRELSPPEGSGSVVLEHVRDMTQQLRTNAALASSQKLASIGRLSSGIAHEINNPLTAIAACAEGLLKRIGTPRFEEDIVKEYLGTIHDEVFRCKEITGKLLESSRPHEPGMATCVPCELIHSAVQLTSPLAERSGVHIRIADCADADLISDGPTIRQILLNLLLNAVEASADGGEVVASCETEGPWCLLRVADTGRGIAPEDLQRLFEPFFTRRPDGSGTGLGLFVSQGLALALGGGIEAESQGPGCGALFTLRLPLNQTTSMTSSATSTEFHHD